MRCKYTERTIISPADTIGLDRDECKQQASDPESLELDTHNLCVYVQTVVEYTVDTADILIPKYRRIKGFLLASGEPGAGDVEGGDRGAGA